MGPLDTSLSLTVLQTGILVRKLDGFEEPVTSCVWTADSQSFITGSMDKENSICQWDLEGNRTHMWTKEFRTTSLDLSPDGQWLVAMDDLQSVHLYNFRTRELEYDWDLKSTPSSVSISQDSRLLLVNKSNGEAQLSDIVTRDVIQKYRGHVGGEYIIRSGFGGANESFVVSGSEGKGTWLVGSWEALTATRRWKRVDLAQVDGHTGPEAGSSRTALQRRVVEPGRPMHVCDVRGRCKDQDVRRFPTTGRVLC